MLLHVSPRPFRVSCNSRVDYFSESLAASSIVKEDLILLQSGKMLSRFGDIEWHNDLEQL